MAFVTLNNIEIQVIRIGEDTKDGPVISIFPAYFEDDKLVAYGEDIISKLEHAA